MKNTCQKGNVTEAKVLARFVETGHLTFIPFGEGHKCDLIFINKSGALKKVQIKKSRLSSFGSFMINLYSNGGGYNKVKYTQKDIDYFATESNGVYYLIPIEKVLDKTTISLREDCGYDF